MGQAVLCKNFVAGPPWLPGTISEQTGPISFAIRLEDGRLWRRHQDHMRPRWKEVDPAPTTGKEEQWEIPLPLERTGEGSSNSEENSATALETSAQQQEPVRDQEDGPARAEIQPTTTNGQRETQDTSPSPPTPAITRKSTRARKAPDRLDL